MTKWTRHVWVEHLLHGRDGAGDSAVNTADKLPSERIHFHVGRLMSKCKQVLICLEVVRCAGGKTQQGKGLGVIFCPMVRGGALVTGLFTAPRWGHLQRDGPGDLVHPCSSRRILWLLGRFSINLC